MKRFTLSALLILLGIIVFDSCKKKGCTDPIGSNYDKNANYDDGTCDYVYGCLDFVSINYDSTSRIDDGSCMSFANWKMWPLVSSTTGIDTVRLGPAHLGNDSISTRTVYIFNDAVTENGFYPEGTMIIKHVSRGDSIYDQFPAMVKQEKGFNKLSNDWEWFLLRGDGSIALDTAGKQLRGANLYDGYCINCHVNATTDFVFSK